MKNKRIFKVISTFVFSLRTGCGTGTGAVLGIGQYQY
jgi:hypothetical protein